jgi:hypothetical protein
LSVPGSLAGLPPSCLCGKLCLANPELNKSKRSGKSLAKAVNYLFNHSLDNRMDDEIDEMRFWKFDILLKDSSSSANFLFVIGTPD